jgi:hypothetical protein
MLLIAFGQTCAGPGSWLLCTEAEQRVKAHTCGCLRRSQLQG